MLTEAIAMATIPAENLARAVKFYKETLGLNQLDSPEGTATFEAGSGSTIFMYERARTKAEHTAVTFLVKDVKATVKELTAKGVKFEQYDIPGIKTDEMGIADMGDGNPIAWLTDPEGNILAIATAE
ncbi:MAG TPA: VOC family protein [Anaerolineales bacterium]|nr:VOC family protein [Anaerolineales bacterium]